MTLRQKNKEHLENCNTLRHRLEQIPNERNVCVIYKDNIIGLGFPKNLLNLASRNFMGLLNNPIKEEIKGVTIYLKI